MRYKIQRANRAAAECFVDEIVFTFGCCDYGLASDDTRMTGVEHISVTRAKNGQDRYPSFTIPLMDLEEFPE